MNKIYWIVIAALTVALLVAVPVSCGTQKKLAARNVENEELKIKLGKCQEDLQELMVSFRALQSVEKNTDTVKVTVKDIQKIVVSENTKLDTIISKINALQEQVSTLNEKIK